MACSVEERRKTGVGLVNGASTLLEEMKILKEIQDQSEAKKTINSELWHACAGPLVSLPQVGGLVYYFPQGHVEQVAFSTKGVATSHIPNYPNLQSQLTCQVHNVTLHADRETDEIYAQMTLQPVNTEKEVFRIPGFGPKPSKHPSEFFCKTLTASDTSTHGGFSVPRRAAEKLFPPLDYAMQPPSQELLVRDLHDNLWTFRHIYRGQPKRHLLTTGWSSFVGAKRLRAGDAVLFIRDEKSQLLLGVRRANRQQTTIPSSVLSAESMHIGVLAAAAHAAANRSPFTIFYNPRACPSEFVIPLPKYQRAVYGNQLSVGMRFGMMFETEESGKRRYTGTIIGTSDLDPLRWPNSKWRNLQVEWDQPGCDEQQNRVSLWDIETPESLFIFPSLTSNLKRSLLPGIVGAEAEWGNPIRRPFFRDQENGNVDLPYPPIPKLDSEQLIKMLLKPPSVIGGSPIQDIATLTQSSAPQNPQFLPSQNNILQCQKPPRNIFEQPITMDSSLVSLTAPISEKVPLKQFGNQSPIKTPVEKPEIPPMIPSDQLSQLTSSEKCGEEKLVGIPFNPQNFLNQLIFQDHGLPQVPYDIDVPQLETSNPNGLFPYPCNLPSQLWDTDDWMLHPSGCGKQSSSIVYPEMVNPIVPPSLSQEIWDPQLNYPRYFSQAEELVQWPQHDPTNIHSFSNSCGLRDPSEESNDQSEIYNGLHFDVSNGGGSTILDPPVSSAVLDGFSVLGDVGLQNSSNCLVGNVVLNQDVQSQITTASITDSQGYSVQEFPDNSVGTSLSALDFGDSSLLQKGSWQQVTPPLRTYTKVQKLGSVGRSVDVTRFKNYEELRSAIACMFGIEGLLDDPRGSGWKLVYTDCENDVLLVGDDMWEDFVSSVRCIRILSPIEFQQMSEDGMQLLNNNVI